MNKLKYCGWMDDGWMWMDVDAGWISLKLKKLCNDMLRKGADEA
jgi:hypothetical protein